MNDSWSQMIDSCIVLLSNTLAISLSLKKLNTVVNKHNENLSYKLSTLTFETPFECKIGWIFFSCTKLQMSLGKFKTGQNGKS